jgi:hypothetical protein
MSSSRFGRSFIVEPTRGDGASAYPRNTYRCRNYMNPRFLLALAAGLSLSLVALAQTTTKQPYRLAPRSQTEAMLPRPASSAASAATPDAASLPRAYRPTGRSSALSGAADTPSNEQKLSRYRAKPDVAASSDAAGPYTYDGWSASSAYGTPASPR